MKFRSTQKELNVVLYDYFTIILQYTS